MQIKTMRILGAVALTGLVACSTLENRGTTTTSSRSTSEKTETARTTEASAPRTAKGMVASRLAFPTGDPSTSALLVEKLVPVQAQVGKSFTYETKVTNLTGFALENVVVSETQATNFTLVDAQPKIASSDAKGRSWRLGTIGPKASQTIRVSGTPKNEEAIKSCLSVSYESALCTAIPVVAPQLRLAASGPAEVLQCDEIVYTYVVTNPGSGSANDVVVFGELPNGLTTGGRPSFSQRIGSLDAGKSSEFELRIAASKTGRFEHTATAKAVGDLTAKAGKVSTTVRKPKLEIAMTGSNRQFAGRDVSYQMTVKNVGDGVAKDLVLESQLPTGVTFESGTSGSKLSGRRLSWKVGNLDSGQERSFQMKLGTDVIGKLTLGATAKAYCADPVAASVPTLLEGIPAILLEVVDLEDPIEVGAKETYVVTVTNQGTAPATNVRIAVELPVNVSYVSASGATSPVGGAIVGQRFQLAPLRTLAPKAKAAWRIVVKGQKSADARFRISMTSDQLTSPVDETEATTFYE